MAESDNVVTLEGNIYFPMDSLKKEHFEQSKSISLCLWKGKANYFSVNVDIDKNCEWYYPKPSFLAKKIKNHVAFVSWLLIKKFVLKNISKLISF